MPRSIDSGGDDVGAKRVLETGLAVVHEGELILPAAGSEAQAEQVGLDARAVIQYHFPVEIEVRGGGERIDPHELAKLVLEKLARRLGTG